MTSRLDFHIPPSSQFQGQARVPGDKSISHRSIIFGALADGITEVSGFLTGADCLATLAAFRAMGVCIEELGEGHLRIHGVGLNGLQAPEQALDLGNSGTSMRLMVGLLAAQPFASTLIGDSSLSKRPMRRVCDPLVSMGADIQTTDEGTAPLHIKPADTLNGIMYSMPVASAQIKSCLLLAGLYAQGPTTIIEPGPSRDHSERMFKGFGYPITQEDDCVTIQAGGRLTASNLDVPADISSAAFFLVGASICPGADLTLRHVGVNPTRDGIITILQQMGADIELLNPRDVGGEPVADIRVRYKGLRGMNVDPALVPLAIDEFPVLFIAAACADGQTTISGAEELRVKESDRIAVMAEGMRTLGIAFEETPGGMVIEGGEIGGGSVHAHEDHRIAMSFAMAALRAKAPVHIQDCRNVDTSFPGFAQLCGQLGLNIETQEVAE